MLFHVSLNSRIVSTLLFEQLKRTWIFLRIYLSCILHAQFQVHRDVIVKLSYVCIRHFHTKNDVADF